MPYIQQWAYHPTTRAWSAAWPTILTDTSRIVHRVTQLGVALAGPDGHGEPVIATTDGIAFTGATSDQPLRLLAPHRYPYPSPVGTPPAATSSCDTGRQPHDLAVAAVLLRCHLLLGADLMVRSGWDLEWVCGVRVGQPSPRHLITELFGTTPASSPLHWPSLAG